MAVRAVRGGPSGTQPATQPPVAAGSASTAAGLSSTAAGPSSAAVRPPTATSSLLTAAGSAGDATADPPPGPPAVTLSRALYESPLHQFLVLQVRVVRRLVFCSVTTHCVAP
jgi:hypothetical protein